jgi:uncharacterized glyoxalase superfamily protein PhnB
MPENAQNIYPGLSYRDPVAAIDWLIKAFGFRKLFAVENPDGTIAHAELAFGPGVIMLGGTKPQRGIQSPLDLPATTQSVYIYLDDPDAHFARARDAGAEVVYEPMDTDYGSREYGVKDLEGHLWSFGTYRPDI